MKKTVLRSYARLIARIGINVKKGQEVIVNAELDCPEFVEMLVKECYIAGAGKVTVEWSHQPVTKINIERRSLEVLSKMEEWEIEKLRHRTEVLPATIYLMSEDPDGLNGIDKEKYQRSTQARYKVIKPFRDKMDNRYQWCIAAVPGKAWAKKIFPDMRVNAAKEKLWEAILKTSRVDPEGNSDPIKNWQNHNEELKNRCVYLNSLGIEALHYKTDRGTDLTVGMISDAEFLGGGEYTLQGNFFNPNIPSEEVFITPRKGKADGIVYATKPLSYRGELIENFYFRFENGKVVEAHAEKNDKLLNLMINVDEGAAYLGECALVPDSSPINRTGILFYNTLFDENAVCHLALGEGFTNTIKNFDKYSLDELHEKGVNESMIHEDFMIGDETLNITATTFKGETIEIFRNGEWAF